MALNSCDVEKAFLSELAAIDREIKRAKDAGYRDWLFGLRERMKQAAKGT